MNLFSNLIIIIINCSFQDSGAAECTTCEAGFYCDSTTTSRDDMYNNKICPAGMFCNYSRIIAPDLENDYCPMGYYCLSGDRVCSWCDLFSFDEVIGVSDESFS